MIFYDANVLYTNLNPFLYSMASNDIGVYKDQESVLSLFCNLHVNGLLLLLVVR